MNYIKSYISVTLEDLNKIKNLDEKIESLFYIDDCVCSKWGINLSTNKFDTNTLKDNSSFKTICTNIIYPKILIFNFDLESNGNLINDFKNLKNNQNKIIHLLNETLEIKNNIYELSGIITMYSYDQFTASIINNKNNNSYIKENNYYYNDGFHDNSKIFSESFKKVKLIDYLKKFVIVSAIYISL